MGLLVGGFGVGQGSIFAAQTWLVARGEFDLLAAFGTHFSFAILGTLFVDAGSITVLARHVARLSSGHTTTKDISRIFWETTLFRLSLATVIVFGGLVYAVVYTAEGFSRSYLISCSPAFLLWACNAAGVLDGLKRSGLSGITGSIAFVASAVGLIFARHASPEVAGAILGGALSLGNLLTVLAQWIALVKQGWTPGVPSITRSGMVRSVKDGIAMLFGILPGQLYFRFQLLLSATFLGAETTALLLYAKQIVSAVTQIIGFVLRVEFPGLVERFSRPGEHNLRAIFGAQKMAVFVAVSSTISVFGVGVLMEFAEGLNFSKAAFLVILFSPTVGTISFMWIVAQAIAALSRYTVLAIIIAIFVAVGMVVSYALLATYGVYAFVAGDLASHGTGIALLYFYLREQRRIHSTHVMQGL